MASSMTSHTLRPGEPFEYKGRRWFFSYMLNCSNKLSVYSFSLEGNNWADTASLPKDIQTAACDYAIRGGYAGLTLQEYIDKMCL